MAKSNRNNAYGLNKNQGPEDPGVRYYVVFVQNGKRVYGGDGLWNREEAERLSAGTYYLSEVVELHKDVPAPPHAFGPPKAGEARVVYAEAPSEDDEAVAEGDETADAA